MAQEDNLLNFSMAVASTRDSSAMKALAVIIALFLPASYVATLFNMSMFDWRASSDGTGDGGQQQDNRVVMPMIWLYWVIAGVLTIIVIFVWRSWWVAQDRDFRRRLPRELDDKPSFASGRARENLGTGFWPDFFHFFREKKKGVAKEDSESQEAAA
jgi:hypothetical protein